MNKWKHVSDLFLFKQNLEILRWRHNRVVFVIGRNKEDDNLKYFDGYLRD